MAAGAGGRAGNREVTLYQGRGNTWEQEGDAELVEGAHQGAGR